MMVLAENLWPNQMICEVATCNFVITIVVMFIENVICHICQLSLNYSSKSSEVHLLHLLSGLNKVKVISTVRVFQRRIL